jgi:SAM-dependent methyltransferase
MYRSKKDLILSIQASSILDLGFAGQGITPDSPNYPFELLRKNCSDVWGIDIVIPERYKNDPKCVQANAENFHLGRKFDVIVAFDLIEHLTNPGLFLQCCKEHLVPGGQIILTTPNAYNLFLMAGKLTRVDPVMNRDHVSLFVPKLMGWLATKCGLTMKEYGYIYTLGIEHEESFNKKVLNILYWSLSQFTSKFCEDFFAILV